MKHVKLFIPGPVEVSQKTFEAFCHPMIGHRSQDFKDLYAAIQPQLRKLFFTQQPVYLSTSSAWGVMEGAIRNLVAKKVLVCMNGAFSDKWYDVAVRCGKEAEKCQVEWGKPILPEQVETKLKQGGFDAVTLIHNETSTGTMSPLKEICQVVKQFPEVCLIVDSVSSFSVVPIEFDALGIDVLLTGSQKALALPPGLALFALSPRAVEKAAKVSGRGYYFDFLEFQKNGAENMTPSTPSLGHIYALQSKLEDIFTEGLESRYARHLATNQLVRQWGEKQGFSLFPQSQYGSRSLNCFRNDRAIDLTQLIKCLKSQYALVIDGGYGKLKGKTFRISNMGDETIESMQILLNAIQEILQ